MKKTFLIFWVLILGTIASIIFIRNSNDHKECSTIIVHSKEANGNDVTTESHICKEKYNF